MSDFMKWGSDWYEGVRQDALTTPVVYERKGKFSVSLRATFATGQVTTDDGNGAVVAYGTWDFITKRASLVDLTGAKFEPQPGDLIHFSDDGENHTYRVSNFGSEPCSVPHDRFRDSVIIHTDFVKTI